MYANIYSVFKYVAYIQLNVILSVVVGEHNRENISHEISQKKIAWLFIREKK